jgi:malonyl CoA-acyl carrier protein transacylase
MKNPLENKYAVVGLGGIFPDAANIEQFWQNILNKHISIAPLPEDNFDHNVFYRPEVYGKTDKNDKTYTNISAQVNSFEFDSRQFKIAPTIAKHMDDNQKVSLLSAQQAIAGGALNSVSKDRVSVFMGSTMVGELHENFQTRFNFDKITHHLKNDPVFGNAFSIDKQDELFDGLRKKILNKTFPVTEDSAPGILPNVIASRICSVFDFHGHAFVVDAACASALAAIICGVQQLKSLESDAVICGAADMLNNETGLIYFSGINALSPSGSYPFDARANGFVIGQGGGVVILKRLVDAIRSGDKIYAVITGYGQVSDGKGKAIAAPNDLWQAKSIQNACEMAGYSAETIELIEAHGTSTQVGDLSEVTALKRSFENLGVKSQGFCGLGSVKSNIGHLKSAAGIAGFLKTVLALHHKVLPPSANFQIENPKLKLSESPFYIVTEPKEWVAKDHPRRAGVNSFGFGGADYHIALEEFRSEDYQNLPEKFFTSAKINQQESHPDQPSSEIAIFSSDNKEDLISQTETFAQKIAVTGENFSDELFHQNYEADSRKKYRLSMTINSVQDFLAKVDLVKSCAYLPEKLKALAAKGIYWSSDKPLTTDQTAILFPGQGSQYPDMMLDICNHYAPAQTLFSRADALWKKMTNSTVSNLIDSSVRGKENTEKSLKNTRNTHPAIMTASLALYSILKEMNFKPGIMVGHSLGEVIALVASGKLDLNEAYRLIDARSKCFDEVPTGMSGSMVALKMNRFAAAELIDTLNVTLAIANINSPAQTIVSGSDSDIQKIIDHCGKNSINAVRLNVSHAFHSQLMKPAEDAFRTQIEKTAFNQGNFKVIANESNEWYGSTEDSIRAQLASQITASVNFAGSIEKLFDEGIRLFIEIGPGNVLSSLTKSILEGKNVTVLNADNKNGSSIESFNRMLCGLFSAGLNIDLIPQMKKTAYATQGINGTQISSSSDSFQTETSLKEKTKIVYSGVAIGLPGSFKKSFKDDNFQQLFDGHNLIERLTDAERERLAELRITKLVKSEMGANYVILDSINQVIQLAGKIGKIDMLNDYHISEKEIVNMSSAIAHAVAAGYEALRDAYIPLIHEYSRTSSGSVLPDKWALPQEMQSETGIIFANGFPMVDPIISEVSRHISNKFGNQLKNEIFDFYDTLIPKITDKTSRKILSDWFTLNYNRLSLCPTQEDVYIFNHQLMNQISSQANNRLARYINARGANFLINAACSSTSTAVTLAEELIRSGRVKRIIVIGADDASSETSLPYLGAGFLSTGACSNEPDLYEAAVPFDKRRNGMVMGAGAIGIIVEAESECKKRGVIPICELVGTHCFNTAGHPSQLDVVRYAAELETFIDRMEKTQGIKRHDIAGQMLYMSHETYTPAKGGCSESEAVALHHVFGENFRKIEISNTKGMTGHTMGASIEDAVAAKALQYSKIPPVVNHKVLDPVLEGLKLSAGGDHKCVYALRMAAGFGSQGNYILLRQMALQDKRIEDPIKHSKWLVSISGIDIPELEYRGRVLVVKDSKIGAIIADRPLIGSRGSNEAKKNATKITQQKTGVVSPANKSHLPIETFVYDTPANANIDVKQIVFDVIAEITGYSSDVLAVDLEIEADLGVDTVKQATILAMLGDKLGIDQQDGFRISDFPTIGKIIELFGGKVNQSISNVKLHPASLVGGFTSNSVREINASENQISDRQTTTLAAPAVSHVKREVLAAISEVTGYPVDMLALEMEIEADLGVDTVKQATILAMLGEKFGMNDKQGFRISDFPTINHIVKLFSERQGLVLSSTGIGDITNKPLEGKSQITSTNGMDVKKEVLTIISNVTGYPVEMLEPQMEIEADLGVDTVKQATILASLSEIFGANQEEGFRISDFPTINSIIELFSLKSITSISNTVNTSDNSPVVKTPVVSATLVNVKDVVLSVISEVTGYPSDMLQPEMEVEADLGVDTVKQATIIAILAEKFGMDQENGFRISDFPKISHIIKLFSELQTNTSHSAKTDSVVFDKSSIESLSKAVMFEDKILKVNLLSESVQDAITAIFSDNTSYPLEMIELDLRVKSDLNLTDDSLAMIRSRIITKFDLGSEWSIGKDSSISEILKSVTTEKIAQQIKLHELINLSRQVLVLNPSPLDVKTIDLHNKTIWIVGDNSEFLKSAKKYFKPFVLSVECFMFPVTGSGEETVENLAKFTLNKTADILIDLTACGTKNETFSEMEPQYVSIWMQRAADCRFAMCKYLQEKNLIPSRILACISVDGSFGIDSNNDILINPIFGLYNGFYKAIRKEWEKSNVSIIDFESSCFGKNANRFLELIKGEISTQSDGVEVCYLKNIRHKLVVRDSSFSALLADNPQIQPITISYKDILVVTGGGSGITSKIVLELAKNFPSTIIVTGRTVLVKNVEKYWQMSIGELQEQKKVIADKLKLGNARVTPVMVEREFNTILKSVEIYQTMQSLQNYGCTAKYYTADIRDIDRMKEILDEVRSCFGPITVLIHGAGVEISHKIDQKSTDEFKQVYSIKTQGAFNLSWLCKNDPLKLVVALSSISGQFGNAAQTDYSAANCYLNFWARMYNRHPGVKAVSLVWSGWGETGMAWRNSYVKDNAALMGLHLIDPELGTRAAVREICFPSTPDVIIHCGLGVMQDPQMSSIDLTRFPLIDRIERDSHRIKAVHRILSTKRDALIDQHRMRGTPLMPGVGFMELMAETYAVLESRYDGPFVFRNLEFSNAFKLYRGEPREVIVEIASDSKDGRYQMSVKSPFKAALSKTPQLREYCKALVSVEDINCQEIMMQDWDIGDAQKFSYTKMINDSIQFSQSIDFGPIFNDIKRPNRLEPDCIISLSDNGIITPLPFPKAQLGLQRYPLGLYLINPAFLDSIHQAGALCSLMLAKMERYFLPFGAEKFVIVKAPKADGTYRIVAKLKEQDNNKMIFNILMLNEGGELCSYVKNSVYLRINQ